MRHVVGVRDGCQHMVLGGVLAVCVNVCARGCVRRRASWAESWPLTGVSLLAQALAPAARAVSGSAPSRGRRGGRIGEGILGGTAQG